MHKLLTDSDACRNCGLFIKHDVPEGYELGTRYCDTCACLMRDPERNKERLELVKEEQIREYKRLADSN
jgi:hypothetical protein